MNLKLSFLKKAASLVCVLALIAGCFAGLSFNVSAAGAALGYWPEPLDIPNQFYYENETLQPYGSCFHIDELKNWSPDNDPDARYNRGAIALRDRWMGPNVNPLASRDAKVMPLAMANARASEAPSQGGDGDFVYAFNNFQYVDIYNFWGGSSGEGPIAIPSPEVIDSAHRNGVPATGTIFIPWGDGAYGNQFVREMVEKDAEGHYIAADKLIEIAQYYGFDGYIFNAESGTGVAGFKDFLAYLQKNKPDNFTITWYNGSGSVGTGSINSWMQDGDTRITDEWWLDMSGSGYMKSSIEAAQQTGVNPWNIHSTWEYWPMKSNAKGGRYQARLGADGILTCSLGILAPTTSLTTSKSSDEFINEQDQFLWVSPDCDPSSTYRPEYEFCGFSHLVADRTPVIGTDFVTTFTTGNGYKFYEDGKVVGKDEKGWFNRSLTDVLPTWRWIIDTEGKKINAKIDFDDAWYAGTSMKLYGDMDANKANHVKLYSCQLDLTAASKFSITYKTATPGVDLSMGLCFGDTYDDANFKFYPVTTTANGEWTTATVDLSADAGKRAIAISLKLNAPEGVNGYALNVGRMAFTTNETAPAATTKVTLDEVIYPTDKTMEARVYWNAAPNAFMYRIHRIHADGRREFVGATPSDAFYLGSFTKDAGEKTCKFEITSYSENGIKGGTTSFEIDWPTEVKDGFVPYFEEGENIALKKPAVSSVRTASDGSAHLLNDGVIPQSKWCADTTRGYAVIDLGENKTIQRWVVYHANCKGAGESPDMNTVGFDLQYAKDDGQPLLTGDNDESRRRVAALSYTVADVVQNNKQDVTDRNLDAPITARYIKLNVTQSDNSAWKAIRIYEFELYEKAAICNTASPLERNVTVKNNVGATDTVVIDNVRMLYSSGTYGDKNGVFHPDTGKVRLFKDLTTTEPFAVVNCTQPTEGYKQRGVGIAEFSNLELDPNGGRLYYDVLDGSGGEVKNSRRASVAYAPETGTPCAEPTVTLTRTTAGKQLRKQYATFTATGVEEGAVIKIFANENSKSPILHTLPAKADGIITQSRVPLDKTGGTVYYEVHKEGKPDSKRFTVKYDNAMNLTADLNGLNELITKCAAINEADCTTETWPAFAAALSSARTVAAGTPNGTEAEAARAALAKAYAKLRFKNSAQRLGELCEKFEAEYQKNHYTADSFKNFSDTLKQAKAMVAGYDSSGYQVEQMRIKLEAAVRGLVEGSGGVTAVVVTPATVALDKGNTGFQFTATVEGEGEISQDVTWSISGNEHEFTQITKEGKFYVSPQETAAKVVVTATSVTDPTVSGKAIVTVNGNGGATTGTVTNVVVSPATATVDKGNTGFAFTATVEGEGDFSQDVTWTVSGNSSDFTRMTDNKLVIGSEETAAKLTVTATSVTDPTVSGKAIVIVNGNGGELPKNENLSLNATIVAYNGNNLGAASGPEKLFDGKKADADNDKWCVDGRNKWVAFDIGADSELTELKMFHAGSNNEWTPSPGAINTAAYEFYVLDESKISANDLLKKNYGERCTLLADSSYWKPLVAKTGNKENITTDDLTGKTGRIFKINISQTDSTGWNPCVRLYELELYGVKSELPPPEITISITPETMQVNTIPGQKGQFTATVEGTSNVDVSWSISGNVSANTMITNGQLFIGEGEKAGTLTVTATSVADPTKKATATVTVVEPTYEIKVNDSVKNGTIVPSANEAAEGTEITLTIAPDAGYRLRTGTLTFNGTAIEGVSFKMPGETAYINAEFVKISVLQAAIGNAEGLEGNAYTSTTWAGLTQKLAAAKAVLNETGSSQEQIDAAANALQAAQDALLRRGDKTALNALIAEVEALKEETYTPATWSGLADKLAAAKKVAGDPDALQLAIDSAKDALAEAKAALVARADKDALKKLIAEVETLDEKAYTSASWKTLSDALTAAKTVDADANATQAAVDDAVKALNAAKDALVSRANKDELNALIAEVEALDEKAYTAETWKNIPEALAAAKAVAEELDATQKAVDAAKDALAKAVKALEAAGNADELNKLIEKAKKEDLTKLTDKSAASIREAIAKAEEVVAQRGTQKELDKAQKALQKALDKAVKKDGKTPTTGDDMHFLLPLTLLGMASAAALVVLLVLSKKKSTR